MAVELMKIVSDYYPPLSKEKLLKEHKNKDFFICFHIDESQKGTFFVEIHELAQVLDNIFKNSYQSFRSSTQKAINSKI